MGMFEKEVVIDCKGHLLGRLASVIAKELLNGQKVTCVRTEGVNISGSLYRNKLKYAEFKRKKMRTNPKRGQRHFRAPSKILWRTIRGMVPHKTQRGTLALDLLKTFEGIPHPYDAKKRVVVPAALKVLKLKNYRKYCKLGDLSHDYGWKSKDVVEKLEAKRKVKSEEFYRKKLAEFKAKQNAAKAVQKDWEKAIGADKALCTSVGLWSPWMLGSLRE